MWVNFGIRVRAAILSTILGVIVLKVLSSAAFIYDFRAQELTMSQEDSFSSPTRLKRQQEKDELASLNDRFLAYKEKNRSLTERNSQLQYEIEQVNTRVGREADEVKKLYEKELRDARRLIDETAKEKARQQLNASKHLARVKELEAE